jgi:hypothetical protein
MASFDAGPEVWIARAHETLCPAGSAALAPITKLIKLRRFMMFYLLNREHFLVQFSE